MIALLRHCYRVSAPVIDCAVHAVFAFIALPLALCAGFSRALRPRSPLAVLDPRVVAITGASSGIGAALAEHYAKTGVTLAITGRNMERLEEVARRCRSKGAIVIATNLDVRDHKAVEDWVATIDDKNPIDLIFANAGVIPESTCDKSSLGSIICEQLEVNTLGATVTMTSALQRMSIRKRGQIAVVGSITGDYHYTREAANSGYVASKAAIAVIGYSLSACARKDNVGVTVLTPGYIDTDVLKGHSGNQPLIMSAKEAVDTIVDGLEHGDVQVTFPASLSTVIHGNSAIPSHLQMQWPRLLTSLFLNTPLFFVGVFDKALSLVKI